MTLAESFRRASNLGRVADLAHAFTTRHGGVSAGPHASLNLGGNTADDPANVAHNRAAACAALGRPAAAWSSASQVHGDRVVEVVAPKQPLGEADALVTRSPEVLLATLTADCVPLLMVAGRAKAAAAVHAGWRGTAAQIAGKAAAACAELGEVPLAALLVAIGPAIGPCCFAIGAEVADKLHAPLAKKTPRHAFFTERNGKLYANLWRLNVAALLAAGVPGQNIEVLAYCTACGQGSFSHRRDAGVTGRQAALIGL